MIGNLKPVVKWPGGKTSEAKKIIPLIRERDGRFIDPFVGGGAIFFEACAEQSVINDLSEELISLYKYIKKGNDKFFHTMHYLDNIRCSLKVLIYDDNLIFLKLFDNYLREKINKKDLKSFVETWVNNNRQRITKCTYEHIESQIFLEEVKNNLIRKLLRMKRLSIEKGRLHDADFYYNIETAIHSAFYMYVRHLYNYSADLNLPPTLSIATFYYIREFCYSSMFRFNKNNKFNVPYGGMAYNSKDFNSKICRLQLPEYRKYLSRTDIYNQDFEDFFRLIEPNENDFIFLDPPYDSDFSTYDQNSFSKADHRRLAKFMKNTKSSFLMVIKNTDFVMNLYGAIPGVNKQIFDKKYMVSFQNRNDKQAKHLIITNYPLSINRNSDY